jgi:hypothetical protein
MLEPNPPERPSKIRRLGKLIVDLVCVFNPIVDAAQKIWIWIKNEWNGMESGMRNGWHLFSVLVILIAAASFFAAWKLYPVLERPNLSLVPPKQNSAAKPLSDKIISVPAPPTIVSTAQVANVELPIQFETSYPITESNNPENELDNIKAQKLARIAAQKESELKQKQSDSDDFWNQMLPTYKDCLGTFYDVLKLEANRRNEAIEKSSNYGYLPPSINYELEETNMAEIRFQNQTNMDFRVSILNFYPALKNLRISGDCGYFEIHHANIYL